MKIAVIGYGAFGRFLCPFLAKHGHAVVCVDRDPVDSGPFPCYPLQQVARLRDEEVDVFVIAVSIPAVEEVLQRCCAAGIFDLRTAKDGRTSGRGPLVVDVLSVKSHARRVMLQLLPQHCDILCTHPMFGPSSRGDVRGLQFMFEKVREETATLLGVSRVDCFLDVWRSEGCEMVQMTCDEHDRHAARGQFVTHLVARTVHELGQMEGQGGGYDGGAPIATPSSRSLCSLSSTLSADSFDLFYGLFRHNDHAPEQIAVLRRALDAVEGRLQQRLKASEAAPEKLYIYHRCPPEMKGGDLLALNCMSEDMGETKRAAARKYSWRGDVMNGTIPHLNCLWNDALHFCPYHPHELYTALVAAGVEVSPFDTYFKVPLDAIGHCESVLYMYTEVRNEVPIGLHIVPDGSRSEHPAGTRGVVFLDDAQRPRKLHPFSEGFRMPPGSNDYFHDSSQFTRLTASRLAAVQAAGPPPATTEYYKACGEAQCIPLTFFHVPHVLVKGAVAVRAQDGSGGAASGVSVVRWSDPPEASA